MSPPPVHRPPLPIEARSHHRRVIRRPAAKVQGEWDKTADLGHSTSSPTKAGQESFKAITRGYYRNAIGAVVVYDIANLDSFVHVGKWLEEAKANGLSGLTFVLVGNKSDKQAE